jgi:glucan phosphoethanolaminetransferase (alkaline phosphatase superfamily)
MSTTLFQRLKIAGKTALFTKETLAAVLFLVGLIAYEKTLLDVPFRHYFQNLQRGEFLIGFGALLIVFVSWIWAGLFFRASLLSSYATRVAYFALFLVAASFEYGYQKAFSRFSTVEDLRIALFDATAEQRADSIVAYASWLVIIPCAVYAALLFKFRAKRQKSWLTLGLMLAVLIVFYTAIGPYVSGHFATISLNAFMRTMIMSPWKWAGGYRGPRQSIALHPEHSPRNNIIFVIDESVRGDHLSINGYGRPTTPYLDELAKQTWLYNWGIAAAGTTCSYASDTLLFTGINLTQLPDPGFQVRKVPSIFQYAKAMGYQTHFLDGQKESYWLGTSYDRAYVDDWQLASSFASTNRFDRDEVLAKKINDIVGQSTGQFIWVIKLGVHYPYTRSFPPAATEWQADARNDQIAPSQNEKLINEYDNALKYNLQSFFRALDVNKWKKQTTLIYTSDHGQTLSEHGEQHTHCGTSTDTFPTEANVPLFMISREPLMVDTGYRASHGNIFATLLDLMDFPANERPREYAPSLLTAKARDSQTRYFWVGDPNERMLGARLKFDQ